MNNVDKIRQLETLVILSDSEKITHSKITRLTAAGENYGSLMLAVDITVNGPDGTRELNTVAKLIPPNDFLQAMFHTQITFRNEIAFYEKIIPTLQAFQREHGVDKVIDFFPKCYGSRINLNPTISSKIDSDAVLLLENIKILKYKNLDRMVGFDLESAKLILKDLAYLHAVPIALKIEKPEVFEKDVKPFLSIRAKPEGEDSLATFHDARGEAIIDVAKSIKELLPILDRLTKSIQEDVHDPQNEPFSTVIHTDCWVNNTMIQLKDGKSVDNKLVDFQECKYGSPGRDIVFFLFSSVQNNVLEEHYNDLIIYYYDIFISILNDLHCNVKLFPFKAFLQEIENSAKHFEFFHLMSMMYPIFRSKGSVKELWEIQPEDLLKSNQESKLHKKKMSFIVKEFAKRNWI